MGRTRPRRGTLLLIEEQGFGDAIQFSRYIPWAASCATAWWSAASRTLLLSLNPSRTSPSRSSSGRTAPRLRRGRPSPVRLVWTVRGSKPSQPKRPTSVRIRALAAEWASRLDGLDPRRGLRIGLAWAGKPTHLNDRNRSMALSTLAPLAHQTQVTFVSLQKGAAQVQRTIWPGPARLSTWAPRSKPSATPWPSSPASTSWCRWTPRSRTWPAPWPDRST